MAGDDYMSEDYVAELLKKDAKESSKKYSLVGVEALMPKRPTTRAPKPNTKFLQNIIRNTDAHNAALKAREVEEAAARLVKARGYDARRGDSEHGRLSRPDDYEHPKKRRRLEDKEESSSRHRRRSRSPHSSRHRAQDRNRDSDRHRWRHHDSSDDEDYHRRRRDRHRRDRSYSSERGHERRRYREESRTRPRERHRRDHKDSSKRKSRRDASPGVDIARAFDSAKRHRHQRSRTRSRSREEKSRRRRDEEQERPHHGDRKHVGHQQRDREEEERRRETSSDSDPLEAIIGPAPPESPKVRRRGRGAMKSSSGIDTRFSSGYDPTTDVQPNSASEDDWDQALEALQDRQRWKQQGADRLRAAGFSEKEVTTWQKGGEKNEEDVRWNAKGEGREWDRGKVVTSDGAVAMPPEWGRLT